MTAAFNRRGIEGVTAGLVAGLSFAVAEIVAVVLSGVEATTAFRYAASVLMGHNAFTTPWALPPVVAGTMIHVILSGTYGLLFGAINDAVSGDAQRRWSREAPLGVVFGALLWVVNFQLIARVAYPWMLELRQSVQLVLHAGFFGLPLGLLYASTERRGAREAWRFGAS